MSSKKGGSTMIFIIIGIIVCVLSLISSSLGGVLFYNYYKEPEYGTIGGKCYDTLTCNPPYICIKGRCYEDCDPKLESTNCRNNHRHPRYNTYYCDVGKCNDWWQEPDQEDYDEYNDIFKQALLRDQENKRIQAEEKAQRAIESEQRKTEQELYEARQAELCKCSTFSGIRLDKPTKSPILCEKGLFENDGDDVLKWCYVAGGQDCKTANVSHNPKTQGMAWKLCGN